MQSNLPKEVAEECWLFEGVYYLGMGYIPYYVEYCDQPNVPIIDYRKQAWFHDGDDILDEINENLSNFMEYKFGMPNPTQAIATHTSYMMKYGDVDLKHIDNVDKDSFHKETEQEISQIQFENEEHLARYKERRQYEYKLIEELQLLDEKYHHKIHTSTEDKEYELYLLLKSGKVKITGTPSSAIKKYETIYPFLSLNFEKDGQEYFGINVNSYCRESIDKANISFDSIEWKNSALFTKDGRCYANVLISFDDLYKEKPQQLEYEIKAKLLGDRIVYNEKTYQEITENSTRGRKPLEWDLFYTELFRYTFKDCKGELPCKQYPLIVHMQQWCKKNLKAGSYGSIQGRIKKIYDSLKSQKIEK